MNRKIQSADDKVIAFPERKTVRTQTAQWIARLEVAEPSKEDLAEFRRWVNESRLHYEEFERLSALWGDLNLLTQMTLPAERDYAEKHRTPRAGVLAWLTESFGGGRQIFVSAVLLALVMVGVFSFNEQLTQPERYQTAIGEQRTLVLSDQSIVRLNTNSLIQVAYSENRRSIHLIKGEAHFDVRKNPVRPFEVHAGAGLVRAVGTAFNVRLKRTEVEVFVDEGVVEIAFSQDSIDSANYASQVGETEDAMSRTSSEPTRLQAGSQATYELEQPQALVLDHDAEADKKLAWQDGFLEFRRDSLAQVVEEVSRYTSTRFVIVDEKTKQQRVGGRFKVGDTEVLLEALETGFGIQVDRVDNNTVYLSYLKGSGN